MTYSRRHEMPKKLMKNFLLMLALFLMVSTPTFAQHGGGGGSRGGGGAGMAGSRGGGSRGSDGLRTGGGFIPRGGPPASRHRCPALHRGRAPARGLVSWVIRQMRP